MNRLFMPVAIALVIGAVVFWSFLSSEDPASAPQPSSPQHAESTATSSAAPAIPAAAEAPVDFSNFRPQNLPRLGDIADQFLKEHGETPQNLLALFTATQNRKFLERALTRFPNDPAVIFVALEGAAGDARTALIESFKAADSQNPLPWIFAAAEAFRAGRHAEGIAELREAMLRPAFYTYFNERAAAMRKLALAGGASAPEAEAWSYFSQTMPHTDAARDAAKGLTAFVDDEIGKGNNAGIASALELLYGVARIYETPEASRTLISQLVGIALERKALEAASNLPQNPLPVDPPRRLAELEQMRNELRALPQSFDRVTMDGSLWLGYFDRFRTQGEAAALRWIQQQSAAR